MSLDKFDPNKGKKDIPQEMIVSSEEIKNLTAKLQEETVKFGSEHPETALWIYDHLNAIKYSGLQGAFKNVIESVHGTFDAERVVMPERTFIVGGADQPAGHHDLATGTNAINGIDFLPSEKDERPLAWKVATLLDLVCHENAHATGKISHELDAGAVLTNVGYATKTVESENIKSTTAVLFNEGVTEVISQRVAREYLTANPMRLEDGSILDTEEYEKFLQSYHLEKGTHKNYAAAREFVKSLCAHIATSRSVSPKLIEDAIVAGYFRGTEGFFQNPDFLDQIMGPGFSEKLRSARFAEDLERIVREHKMTPIGQDIQEEIENLLKEFLAKR